MPPGRHPQAGDERRDLPEHLLPAPRPTVRYNVQTIVPFTCENDRGLDWTLVQHALGVYSVEQCITVALAPDAACPDLSIAICPTGRHTALDNRNHQPGEG